MTITTGVCTSDPRVLDKRPYFTDTRSMTAQYKSAVNDQKPDIIISTADWPSVHNYMQIGSNYYYIRDYTRMPGGQTMLHCELDPLTSMADQIRDLNVTVIRQEHDTSGRLIIDQAYTYQANRQCQTLAFNRTPFTANYASDRVYLLTVLGGVDGATE